MGPVRVFIVDDYPLLRASVRLAFQHVGDFQIAGEASGYVEFMEKLPGLRAVVDVVLLDGQLAEGGTLEILQVVESWAGTSPPVVVLSSEPGDGDLVAAARRAGVRGHLTRRASPDELMWTLRLVAGGGMVFGPGVTFERDGRAAVAEGANRPVFPQLTDREREVLDLIARGWDNGGIARSLSLSDKTIRNHVSRVFAKLNVTKRVEAAIVAREAGLGQGSLG